MNDVGLDTAGIVEAVRSEISSTYRVYRSEWLIASRHEMAEKSQEYFEATFSGRLHEGDWRYERDIDGSTVLWVRRWNVCAEWKRKEFAEAWATALLEEQPELGEIKIVARNSRSEHVLTQYGILKLP